MVQVEHLKSSEQVHLTLPPGYAADDAVARIQDGVLTLTVPARGPQAAKAQSHREATAVTPSTDPVTSNPESALEAQQLLSAMPPAAHVPTEYDIPGGSAALAEFAARVATVCDFGNLGWTRECCAEGYDHRGFLEKQGVFDRGCWKREASYHTGVPWGKLEGSDGFALPPDCCPSQTSVSTAAACIRSWPEYYEQRRIHTSSPIAVVLSFPLTLHWIFQRLKLTGGGRSRGVLVVHLLGVEKELDQLTAFEELHRLYPDLALYLVMVGPAVPEARMEPRRFQTEGHPGLLQISFCHGLYHEARAQGLPRPDAVVGLNLGLFAWNKYPSLAATAWLLAKDQVSPVVLTDFTELGADQTRHIFAQLGVDLSWPVEVNPFRRPVVQRTTVGYNGNEHRLPVCANGFIFGVHTVTNLNVREGAP